MAAAASQGTDIPGITPEHFVQYVADNVDHNVRTLDGFNTFHDIITVVLIKRGIQVFLRAEWYGNLVWGIWYGYLVWESLLP